MELLEALKVIREECKKHVNCGMCPMRTDNTECALRKNYPQNWTLSCDCETPRLFS